MPNWVYNKLSVDKNFKKIAKFVKGIDDKGKDYLFDFNKIIPRPDTLDITSGTSTARALAVIAAEAGDFSKIERFFNPENEESLEDLIIKLTKESDKVIDGNFTGSSKGRTPRQEAEMYLSNVEKYGVGDWYSWATKFWDTKWNACEIEVTKDAFIFQTAWSSPFNVLRVLSEKFPKVTFKLEYADEDKGYNCGWMVYKKGELYDKDEMLNGSDEARKYARELPYGGPLSAEERAEYPVDEDYNWIEEEEEVTTEN